MSEPMKIVSVTDKFRTDRCFGLSVELYEQLLAALKPECRFVHADVRERHVHVRHADSGSVCVFYVPDGWQKHDEVVVMDDPEARARTGQVRVADKTLDLARSFIGNGQIAVQRIDNGFTLHVTTVAQPAPGQLVGTQRTLYCATVADVLRTLSDLLQLPARPDFVERNEPIPGVDLS